MFVLGLLALLGSYMYSSRKDQMSRWFQDTRARAPRALFVTRFFGLEGGEVY
jgi:hypothetical protein